MESRNAQIARENERLRLEGIARERDAVQAALLAQQIRSRADDIVYIASTPVVGADVVKDASLARRPVFSSAIVGGGVVGGAVLRGGSARLEGFRRLSEDVEEEDLDDEEMDDEEFDGELDDELDDEDFDDEDME